jgi:hypothetical protein
MKTFLTTAAIVAALSFPAFAETTNSQGQGDSSKDSVKASDEKAQPAIGQQQKRNGNPALGGSATSGMGNVGSAGGSESGSAGGSSSSSGTGGASQGGGGGSGGANK